VSLARSGQSDTSIQPVEVLVMSSSIARRPVGGVGGVGEDSGETFSGGAGCGIAAVRRTSRVVPTYARAATTRVARTVVATLVANRIRLTTL
jgi:hypothetical protein